MKTNNINFSLANIEKFIRKKNIKILIVHGLFTSGHTHRYIHNGIYDAFMYISKKIKNIHVYWLDDTKDSQQEYIYDENYLIFTSPHYNTDRFLPIVNNGYYILHYRTHNIIKNEIITKYNDLLLSKRAVKYVEFRGNPNKHFDKNLITYIKNTPFWYYYNSPNKNEYDDTKDIQKKNYNYSFYPANDLHIPWATNLLPEEIDKNMNLVKRGVKYEISSYFCGSVWHTNQKEIDSWKRICNKHDLKFICNREKDEDIHQSSIRKSLIAPAIQGETQRESSNFYYIPCRIFKNISYGAMPITNNIGVYDFFKDYFILYDSDLESLFKKSIDEREEEKKNPLVYKKKMLKLMNYVKNNHTYLNRIEMLIRYGFH